MLLVSDTLHAKDLLVKKNFTDQERVQISTKLALVREYRFIFGPILARNMWIELGLPEPDEVLLPRQLELPLFEEVSNDNGPTVVK